MIPFRGNINGSVDSQAYNLPMVVNNFTLVNMTGGAVGFGVYLIKGARSVMVAPFGSTINVNEKYTDDLPRVLEPGEVVRLVTGGNVGYDFEMDNTQAP
jgi:hypothetical protein